MAARVRLNARGGGEGALRPGAEGGREARLRGVPRRVAPQRGGALRSSRRVAAEVGARQPVRLAAARARRALLALAASAGRTAQSGGRSADACRPSLVGPLSLAWQRTLDSDLLAAGGAPRRAAAEGGIPPRRDGPGGAAWAAGDAGDEGLGLLPMHIACHWSIAKSGSVGGPLPHTLIFHATARRRARQSRARSLGTLTPRLRSTARRTRGTRSTLSSRSGCGTSRRASHARRPRAGEEEAAAAAPAPSSSSGRGAAGHAYSPSRLRSASGETHGGSPRRTRRCTPPRWLRRCCSALSRAGGYPRSPACRAAPGVPRRGSCGTVASRRAPPISGTCRASAGTARAASIGWPPAAPTPPSSRPPTRPPASSGAARAPSRALARSGEAQCGARPSPRCTAGTHSRTKSARMVRRLGCCSRRHGKPTRSCSAPPPRRVPLVRRRRGARAQPLSISTASAAAVAERRKRRRWSSMRRWQTRSLALTARASCTFPLGSGCGRLASRATCA